MSRLSSVGACTRAPPIPSDENSLANAISTMAPNVMIMVNGVVQPTSAYTVTNSNTITLDEAVPIGTNFYLAAAAPPTLPNFTDIVRTSAPATLGQDLIFNGSLWTPSAPRHKNFLINGGANIWQRGTSFPDAADGSYFADRWQAGNNNDGQPNFQKSSKKADQKLKH